MVRLALALGLATLAAAPADASTLQSRYGTYTLRLDTRRCAYPACGGWWLEAVNHDQLRCADGSVATACYVAEIAWGALGWDPRVVQQVEQAAVAGTILVTGVQRERTFGPAGPWGVLRPRSVWSLFQP